VLAVTACALLAGAGGANASSGIRYGIRDDAWLLYGPEPPAQRIQILQRLGVDVVRMTLRWDYVAQQAPEGARDPGDAAYDWSLYDPILERLHDARIDVLLTLWGMPEWANGGQNPNRMPTSVTSLAAFAFATARSSRSASRSRGRRGPADITQHPPATA
jgi:hypothetical protein